MTDTELTEMWEEMAALRAGCVKADDDEEQVNRIFALLILIGLVAFIVACFTIPGFWNEFLSIMSGLLDTCVSYRPDGTCASYGF